MDKIEMDLFKAIEWYGRKSKAIYSCGHIYETLDWHEDNELPKPTLKDLETAWKEYLQNKDITQYKLLRAAEYPPIEAQLDLIYREGLEAWMNLIQSIKVKYPNPIAPITLKSTIRKTPMQEQIEALNNKIDNLAKKVDTQQLNAKDIELITNEIKAGMFAIKGFMMEIPNIQKQIEELKEQLTHNHECKDAIS